MKNLAFAIATVLISSSSYATPPVKYLTGVHDATQAESSELDNLLEPLAKTNASLIWNNAQTRVKVVTWKSTSAYEGYLLPFTQTSSSEDYVTWVTLAPKVENFCRNFMKNHPTATEAQLNLRLKQYLGLNSDWNYDVFVELWVNPSDVFRPCVDPDPSDSSCALDFGATIPKVKNIANYKNFYQNLYYKSFRQKPGVPWTGLGYTYDWNNITHKIGASEFILSPLTTYTIERAVPTLQYCAP